MGGQPWPDFRERKSTLLASIHALGAPADTTGRYELEDQLSVIYTDEEAYWHQWGTQQWVLRGDFSIAYFQAIANGRRRRNSVHCLWDGDTILLRPTEIRAHVDGFYKALFPLPLGVAPLWP